MLPLDSYDCGVSSILCEPHSHMHCLACDRVLLAQGEGGVYADDPPTIDGYENSALCDLCKDKDYLLCTECKKKDPLCPVCRKDVEKPCGPDCGDCAAGMVA